MDLSGESFPTALVLLMIVLLPKVALRGPAAVLGEKAGGLPQTHWQPGSSETEAAGTGMNGYSTIESTCRCS